MQRVVVLCVARLRREIARELRAIRRAERGKKRARHFCVAKGVVRHRLPVSRDGERVAMPLRCKNRHALFDRRTLRKSGDDLQGEQADRQPVSAGGG